ncbi:MAG: rRNA maturation RNase YbeY [Epulopiscium sp.]|nr:rRNA maturation RNase YbeY [Candidatus Epulonipiscium sp.]
MENNTSFLLSDNIKTLIHKIIEQTLREERYPSTVEISLTFVGNEEIQRINNEFRNIDKATDVLSFPLLEFEASDDENDEEFSLEGLDDYMNPDTGDLMLGDIIISVDKAKEQAREYGHSIEREIGFLIAHSMFHLMGYDHMTEDEEKEMVEKQERVLGLVGLGR